MRQAYALVAGLLVTGLFVFAQNSATQNADPGIDVQAFIPNLTPLNGTMPPPRDVSATIQLLVTLDSTGRVSAVEPLTGPQDLRKTAAALVQEWRYRPVLRDGHSVPAYTTALVIFVAPGKPNIFDSTSELAFVARTSELQKKYPRTPAIILSDLEQDSTDLSSQERFYALAKLAKAAWTAGATDKAAGYATELLASVSSNSKDWNDGNAMHDGNSILGLVALHVGNLAQAGKYLLEAGRTSGSPQLNSFGPNMTLAKGLLEQGQKDVVLQYFEECRTFWKLGTKQLDDWTDAVQAGRTPDFGANLVY